MATLIKKLINTTMAPRPVAPFSHAVGVDRTIYVSGCVGMDKDTMELVPGGVAQQTKQALKNLEIILEAAGSCIDNVVKTTIYVTDLNEFSIVNEQYKQVFYKNFPARTYVEVARLRKDALVEIECIAVTGDIRAVGNYRMKI